MCKLLYVMAGEALLCVPAAGHYSGGTEQTRGPMQPAACLLEAA